MDRITAMTTFVKVVETGSLSAAARALELSLASVSRQIDGLEDHLRTRLLVRTTRQLALTEGGRTYYEQAKGILAAVEEAEITLTARHATPAGRLVVSSPVPFGRVHLAALVPGFLERHPDVTVDLLLLDRVVNLVEEGIDIAIRPGELEDSSLVARKLGAFHRVLCAAPAYLQRRGEPQHPRELEDHDCILYTVLDIAQTWRFHSPEGELQAPVTGRLRSNNLDAAIEAAVNGAGLVLVPSWLVRDHVIAGRLVPVLQAFEAPKIPIHALFPHARLMSAKVRAFTDYLVERCVIEDLNHPVPQ